MCTLAFFSLFALWLLIIEAKASSSSNDHKVDDDCGIIKHHKVLGRIGGVIDERSRVGKEQKIAMSMAVHDFNTLSSSCSKLVLHLKHSYGSSARAASAAIELVNNKQVHAILGAFTLQEATLVWEFDKVSKNIPIISINPMAIAPLLPIRSQLLIQMGNDITSQMQCIAAIVGRFGWRKVIAVYENSNNFSIDSELIIQLSDSLKLVDSTVEHHIAFPSVRSLSEPEKFIEEELKKLRRKNTKVFIVLQSSLDFAMVLFERAMEMGMVGKSYVWIVSDDVASLLDSVEPSIIANMQGVIGFKTKYIDNSESFKEFNLRFARNYRSEYPEEENHANPSIHALRAYDAICTIAKAMQNFEWKMNSNRLVKYILSSNFEGVSGKIIFKNDELLPKPTFWIINVIGKSYREITLWSPKFGFLEDHNRLDETNTRIGNRALVELGSIYWPGGEQIVPKGWSLGAIKEPLRIGVPANGVFHQFVNVTYDKDRNTTSISGYSIQVFEAIVKELSYDLSYVLLPYNGTYDGIVDEVSKKTFDAAVGDIAILADRYEIAAFSQPYTESGIVLIVTEEKDEKKTRFIVMRAFKIEMWILMAGMTMSTGIIVWLTEHVSGNSEFQASFPKNIGSILWFSITVLTIAQRESIKSNLSRLVLTTWLFVVFVVSACLTANLASMMTVPRLQPSKLNVDYLRSINAPVGCNANSFIGRYLESVLGFRSENIKQIHSFNDYPRAFEKGEIRAAFFTNPHSKVFLAKFCKGYMTMGPVFKLGGLGFVFQKGSPLATDISEAILKITQNGKMNQLEDELLSASSCSSSKTEADDDPIGLGPFSGLLMISGTISAIALSVTLARLLENHLSIHRIMMNKRVFRWASLVLTECFSRFGLRFFKRPIVQRPDQQMNKPHDQIDQSTMAIELAANRSI